MTDKNPGKRIRDAIIDSRTIPEGSVVIVGVSGGPDSLCLLHALSDLSDSMDLKLSVVHVNHMLRGEKSNEEAERVEEFCDRLGITCTVFELDCKEYAEELGVSCEEAGRIARYEIFDEVAQTIEEPGDTIRIAVAHNSDDQAETVLFRLMRGTGTHGLGGIELMRESDMGYTIVRPLINVSRREIEEYIEANKLHPNMDESNNVADVSRNKIRLELIPYIEKNFNPNFKEALIRYAEMARTEDMLLTDYAIECGGEFLEKEEDRDVVIINTYGAGRLEEPLLSRLIFVALENIDVYNGITHGHINSIIKLIRSNNPSASIDLPGDIVAVREYGELLIGPREYINENREIENIEYELSIKVLKKAEYDARRDASYHAAFDFDEFNKVYPGKVGELCLRSRREGDFIAIKNGRKKLQDYLVDAKVRKNERDDVLLVAIGSEILWVVSTKKYSHNYQINDMTERVLFLELSE